MDVGFIGLGAMGALIVPRLMAAGHRVTGWNRSRQKAKELIASGMTWAGTPREAAEKSEIVFSIVTDGTAVRAVALGDDGVLAGLKPGGVYADMSTISPQASAFTIGRTSAFTSPRISATTSSDLIPPL